MNTQASQIQLKVSLSARLNELLQEKAARLGVPVTQFVKHLIIKEVDEDDYPTFQMSARTERRAKKALAERHKAIVVDDIHEYFKNL